MFDSALLSGRGHCGPWGHLCVPTNVPLAVTGVQHQRSLSFSHYFFPERCGKTSPFFWSHFFLFEAFEAVSWSNVVLFAVWVAPAWLSKHCSIFSDGIVGKGGCLSSEGIGGGVAGVHVGTGVVNSFGVWVCVSMGVNMSHNEGDVNRRVAVKMGFCVAALHK